jgi:hypothetical protein
VIRRVPLRRFGRPRRFLLLSIAGAGLEIIARQTSRKPRTNVAQ